MAHCFGKAANPSVASRLRRASANCKITSYDFALRSLCNREDKQIGKTSATLRFHFSIAGGVIDVRALPIDEMIVVLSLAAIIIASPIAVFERNLKRLLALLRRSPEALIEMARKRRAVHTEYSIH